MRLDVDTPVQISLREALNPVGNKVGRPKLTWLKTIAEDLKTGGFELNLNRPERFLAVLTNLIEDQK